MHKLVILIEPSSEWENHEDQWPDFLHLVEEMPGLRREATSRIEQFLFGEKIYSQMHELFFNALADIELAMASPQGREAGRLLQQMTGGHLTLFFAEHTEDTLDNIRKFRQQGSRSEQK